ncbi:MAG: methyltransferase [Bacteroidales bacterium]|nr:methyltransferase [Bacteroidales bacterium]
MPNTYFQFKQFTIYHDKCAMKVGTDGVLLGAWANVDKAPDILDVGTGTGLIAIMLAQRCGAKIDAVEIDENAFNQAGENISACPWHQRIRLIKSSFQDYSAKCDKAYDLVVSNPPYFRNQFRPPERSRAMARHDDALSLKDLLFYACLILKPEGIISIVLPVDMLDKYRCWLLQNKLHIRRMLYVMPFPGRPVKRILAEAGRERKAVEEEHLAIESGKRHHYTQQYIELTRAFYLAF